MGTGRTLRSRLALVVVLAVVALTAVIRDGGAARAGLPPGFSQTTWWSAPVTLGHPTAIAFAPDGEVFVAIKEGLVLQFDDTSDTTPTVFADLRTDVYSVWDHGLLGLVVDPKWPARPYVYVRYALDAPLGHQSPYWNDVCPSPPGVNDDGCVVQGRISRLAANGTAPAIEKVLVQGWCYQGPSHAVGALRFGPDGYLYAASGDGSLLNGSDWGQHGIPPNPCGDPPGGVGTALSFPTTEGGSLRAQDLRTPGDPVSLDGAVIRIDPDTGAGAPDNPLASSTDANARRIIAYGLRNPFRFTFEPGSDAMFVADVGELSWEEVDRIEHVGDSKVEDFGWPCYEGVNKHPSWASFGSNLCNGLYASPGAVTAPYYTYPHVGAPFPPDCGDNQGAITGIAVHSTSSWPAQYRGALFFSDYSRNCTFVMPRGADGHPDPTKVALFSAQTEGVVDLVEAPGGDLWYVSLGPCNCIRRIHYAAGNAPPNAVIDATPEYGPVPLAVHLSAAGSRDPEGSALTYAWDLDGDGKFDDATGVAPTRTYKAARPVDVAVRVTDVHGAASIARVTLHPGDAPPTIALTKPTAGLKFSVGDVIPFAATAKDAHGAALSPAHLHWDLVLHHCTGDLSSCHEHLAATADGVASGTFIAPNHGYPSYLELRATATNDAGLSSTATREIDPRTAPVKLRVNVSNATIWFNDVAGTGTLQTRAILGSTAVVSASATSDTGAPFLSWSDGGARAHEVVVGAGGLTLSARYDPRPVITPGVGSGVESSGVVNIPLTLDKAKSSAVSVQWTALSGTASVPGDVSVTTGKVVIPAGAVQAVIAVPIVNDTEHEGDEQFLVSLHDAVGARIGGYLGLGVGVIVDDD